MAATEKQIANLKPIKPGEVRNPKGKAKGTLNSKTVIEKWLKVKETIQHPITGETVKLSQMDIITLAMVKQARSGNTNAYNALMNRKEGMPMQKQQIQQKNITVSVQEDDEEVDDQLPD